jgi:hypothetical protein
MQADTLDAMSGREAVLGYRMGTELTALASFGNRHAPGRLVQLSLEHLTLGHGERWATALEAEVMDVRGAPEVSLRFVAPPLDAGRRIVSVLEALRDNGLLLPPETRPVWRERIVRGERVARICEALASRKARGVARGEDGAGVEVTAAFFDARGGRMSPACG